MVILIKSQRNWVKIVDFLMITYSWATCQFWVRNSAYCSPDQRSHIYLDPISKCELVKILILFNNEICKHLRHCLTGLTDRFKTLMGNSEHHNGHIEIVMSD